MTPIERGRGSAQEPVDAIRESWESGQRSVSEAWLQAQDFWNSVARNWGEAVGLWYGDFGQTSDAEVVTLLARARDEHTFDPTPSV